MTATATAASTERRPVLVVAGVVGVLAIIWKPLAVWWGYSPSPTTVDLVAATVETIAALVGAVCALIAAQRHATARTAWRLIGLGVFAWGAGNACYTAMVLLGLPTPIPSWPDLGYLLSTPLLAAGVFVWPHDRSRDRDFGAVVDGLISGASILLLLWIGAFHQIATAGQTSAAELAVSLLYPIGDVVILLMVIAALRRASRSSRQQLELLALGLATLTLADLLYSVIATTDTTELPAAAVDTPWIVGFTLIAGAAAIAMQSPAGSTYSAATPSAEGREPDRFVVSIASGLSAAALLLAVVQIALANELDATLLALAGLLLGLVLARQVWTLRTNRRLTDRLNVDIAKLGAQARSDSLTGLPNRVGLEARIEAARRRAVASERTAAVMFVDLDHLKRVNDSLGHTAGDVLITTMARRLTDQLGDRVTRFGGDEFVAVIDDLDDGAAVSDLAARVVAESTAPIEIDGMSIRPSLSIGAAVMELGVPPAELLRRADIALYQSKSAGRQRSALFHARMDERSRRRIDIEPELRRAVEEDQFAVYYQPVVSLIGEHLIGAEALLRWQHPQRGLIMPSEFLSEAEVSGLLARIGEHTLIRAATDFSACNRDSGRSPVAVSVNLSTSELADRHVVARVGLALSKSGIPPRLFGIEITEDVIINRSVRRTIDDLLDLGVTLSIDDFGTGNSSLRQLGSYPATALKIDKSYVDRIDESPEGAKVVRAIIGLAEQFGLFTIAEGVERQSQAERLIELGCYAGQGWLFGRAVPYDDFRTKWLKSATPQIELRADTPRPA